MAISESDLFRGVSQRFITKIAHGAEEQTFRKNTVIFKAGERADHFYVLMSGDVHIEIGETEKATLAVSRPGEVFGWSALVEPYKFTAVAKSIHETKVMKISRDSIEAAIKEHPEEGLAVLRNLTGIIAGRLRFAYRQLVPEA
ncbi:MAG TPA: cyclic nucleotide-binding domain-containing protein [Syntrophorhabdaceae bacterium]|jgi:CRP-like cAMP-binding protein